MTPRPLYKWKTFWLGLLVLIFLGWAWHASKDRFTVYRGDTPVIWLAIGQYQGEAGLFSGHGASAIGTWRYLVSDVPSTSHIFRNEWANGSSEFALIVAPHSRLILLFLIAWASLLAWRWHRIHRRSSHLPL